MIPADCRNVRLGFTGTRGELSWIQKWALVDVFSLLLREGRVTEFHHGDCVGADEWAHGFVRHMSPVSSVSNRIEVVTHPPLNDKHRAYCRGDREMAPLGYMVRNHAIVDDTHVMLAAPAQREEKLRSGTWATIRYARKIGRPIIIAFPDGARQITNWLQERPDE